MLDDAMIKRLAVQSRLHNFLIEMGCINQFYPIEQLQSFARTCYAAGQKDAEMQLVELRIHNELLIGAVKNLTDICITQVGADYNDVIRAAYLKGVEALIDTVYGNSAFTLSALRSFSQECYVAGQADAQPEHTPVEPEEVFSPNTVILGDVK